MTICHRINMTNETLVDLIRSGNDPDGEYMLQLWQQNKGMIWKLAGKYSGYAEKEDLVQEGFIGLSNAVRGYEPLKGIPFINYAVFWIKQSMLQYIENCSRVVRVPVQMYDLVIKYKQTFTQFRRDLGREPSEDEIRGFLGIEQETLGSLKKAARMGDMKSLNDIIPDADGLTVADAVADPRDEYGDLIEDIQNEELAEVLWPMVDDLPDRQGQIIRLRYAEGLTLQQAADTAGVALNIARRQERKAFNALRHPSRSDRLQPFLSDHALSVAYHGSVAAFDRTWTSSTERAAISELE